jgi:hypothetical protein
MAVELTDLVKKDGEDYIVNVKGGPYYVRHTEVFHWVICERDGNTFMQYAPGKFAIGLISAEEAVKALLRRAAAQ